MSFAGGVQNIQSAYQLKAIRYGNIQPRDSFNCLMCGRCESVCPVGIDISGIRMITRNELNGRKPDPSFNQQPLPPAKTADVIYFAGCMGHQTPSVKKAMLSIFKEAGVNYWFMDEAGGLCCGRPMMLAGHHEQAKIMMEKNSKMITGSGASVLVTSCPICYKIFREEYNLNIEVLHHSEYLYKLADRKTIHLRTSGTVVAYHDPCELSRDLKVYDEPRKLLSYVSNVAHGVYEKDNGLCCGNSLANFSSGNNVRLEVTRDAYNKIVPENAQFLVTSCPMCKKSFQKVANIPVMDIAEMIFHSMQRNQQHAAPHQRKAKISASIAG